MLLITCPVCGVEGDETEFHAGGEAHIKRPATTDPENVSDEAQRDYLYMRKNPRGLHFERWMCARGCGKWFHAARDTVTMEFKAFYGARDPEPDLEAAAKPKTSKPRKTTRKKADGA